MSNATARLDAFTDAAFAFAVSLMVVGGGGFLDFDGLLAVISAIPSFIIGFAIIAMFWWGHVRWRNFRGDAGFLGIALTFALILAVLVYVHPLRAMSASFASYLTGAPDPYPGKLNLLFRIYGLGFVVMAGLMAALFADARKAVPDCRTINGEIGVWLILIATGLVSIALTFAGGLSPYAPIAYAALPVSIGAFVSLWQWGEPEAKR